MGCVWGGGRKKGWYAVEAGRCWALAYRVVVQVDSTPSVEGVVCWEGVEPFGGLRGEEDDTLAPLHLREGVGGFTHIEIVLFGCK